MAIVGVVSVSGKPVPEMADTVLDLQVEERLFPLHDGGQLHAVGKLEFCLAAQSFTCIVGPSGCGKTTTLRMILGLDKHFKGRILQPAGDRVAAVFQEPRLLPWRTVEQNIRLVLPKVQRQQSLEELLAVLELAEVRDFYPAQLSLGLARRASLARAFVLKPQLLILDEPFVSLDDNTAERLRNLLIALWQQQHTTALMVTHNLREAALLADRILVFGRRPTCVIGELPVERPRSRRNPEFVDTIVAQMQRIIRGSTSEVVLDSGG